jgi:hypothetical protein
LPGNGRASTGNAGSDDGKAQADCKPAKDTNLSSTLRLCVDKSRLASYIVDINIMPPTVLRKIKYKEKEPSSGTHGFTKQRKNSANDCDLSDASPEIKSGSQFPILCGFRFGNRVSVHCPWCDRMYVRGRGPQFRSLVSFVISEAQKCEAAFGSCLERGGLAKVRKRKRTVLRLAPRRLSNKPNNAQTKTLRGSANPGREFRKDII